MEQWGILALFLIGFALLQAVLYRYFQRGGTSSEQPTGQHSARADASHEPESPALDLRFEPDREGRAPDEEADGIHCQHCGAENERDAVYTYCRQCTQPLE